MTERDKIAQVVLASGVDLTEDGVGSQEENARRIAEAVIAGREEGYTAGMSPDQTNTFERVDRALRLEIGRWLPSDMTADVAHMAARIAVFAASSPGAPKTDELARNAARNALIIPIGSITDGTGITEDSEVIGAIADTVTRNHTVTWERDVNANEVPVRRYVLRGAWEVDPEAARGGAR